VYDFCFPNDMLIRISLLLILAAASSSAESRAWKSADGRILQAEFVSRDSTSVIVLTEAGKQLTLPISKLHPDEIAWLNKTHSLDGPVPDPKAVFDTLLFGDDRETVTRKLKASKVVEMTSDEAFLGRSGLNGAFSTRQPVGKEKASLYFEFDGGGKLSELTLQTDLMPGTEYDSELKPTWMAFVELLGALYGKPVQKGPLPSKTSLKDGMFFPSHLWALPGDNSALLGTACSGNQYQLVVRFTRKTIKPVEIP
jgi:hypothetical protein